MFISDGERSSIEGLIVWGFYLLFEIFLLIDLIATNTRTHTHTHTYILCCSCLIPFIFALHSSFLYSKPHSVPPMFPGHQPFQYRPAGVIFLKSLSAPLTLGLPHSPETGKMDGSWRIMALALFSLEEKDYFEMPLICLPDFPSRTVSGAHSHACIDSPTSRPTSLLVLPLGVSTFSQACCELLNILW